MFPSSREVAERCRKIRNGEGRSLVYGRVLGAAATTPNKPSVEYGSTKYFLLCGFGGVFSCGLTHTIVVPLDLIKTRLQVNQAKYKNLATGLRMTAREEGPKALYKGWLPTLIGYSFQGSFKFGFYEFFKAKYAKMLGEQAAYDWRTFIHLFSSASAEFLADIALSPWEAVRVKMQTSQDFPQKLYPALKKMYAEEGLNAFYKSLVPLWGRQIPYTMMKFACFERTLEFIYKKVTKPKEECSKGVQLLVTFAAGYFSGLLCAAVSHPADTVLSHMNQEKAMKAIDIIKKLGVKNLYKGFFARVFMIGTFTGIEWFNYDFVKVLLNLPRPPPPERPKTKVST